MASNNLSLTQNFLSTNLERIGPWVEAETGMDFSGTRVARLAAALDKVLPAASSRQHLEHLCANPQDRAAFLERLTVELTVGESFFFRNEHHIRALREEVLPDILSHNSGAGEVRIWSAGCATGEEPYSLAILLDQLQTSPNPRRVSILGTDLNSEFLERARAGCYRSWSFRQTDINENRSYFTRHQDTFQISSRIREQVRFAYLNLVKDVYPSTLTGTYGLDLILFRNVAIYLRPEVTAQIIERFREALRPGGWLLLGEAEVGLAVGRGFEVRRLGQATFHQKAPRSEPPNDKLPISPPVLAGCSLMPGPARSMGVTLSASPPSIPGVPTLPAWVPLPKKSSAAAKNRPPNHHIEATGHTPNSGFEKLTRLISAQEWDAAERAIESLGNKKQRARDRLRLAQALLKHAQMDRVRSLLDQCLNEDALLIEAHLLRASLFEETGELDRAEIAYRKALFVDRHSVIAHFHLGLLLQQKGDTIGSERSLRTVRKMIESKNPHDLVEHGEGVCFGRLLEMLQVVSSRKSHAASNH